MEVNASLLNNCSSKYQLIVDTSDNNPDDQAVVQQSTENQARARSLFQIALGINKPSQEQGIIRMTSETSQQKHEKHNRINIARDRLRKLRCYDGRTKTFTKQKPVKIQSATSL